MVLVWNLSTFLFRFTRVKIFPVLYYFPDAHANLRGHTSHLHVDMLSSSMPPTQFTWNFCCVLFTLGDSDTSCSATLATYVTFSLENYQREVYFRKQMYFPLCHPRKFFGISFLEHIASSLLSDTSAFPAMPHPHTQLMCNAKGIILSIFYRSIWSVSSVCVDTNAFNCKLFVEFIRFCRSNGPLSEKKKM